MSEVQGEGNLIVYSGVPEVQCEGNATAYNVVCLKYRVREILLCTLMCVRSTV